MLTSGRIQRHVLRALIAALLLWAAPARPVWAAPLAAEVPVLIAERVQGAAGIRARAPSETVREPVAMPAAALPRFAALEPALPLHRAGLPRYLLYCALLR